MAGQIPLHIEASGRNHSVPDHFETFTKTYDNAQSTDNDGALFYAERDTIIDSAFAVHNDSDTDLTFTIKQAPSGTALGSATAVSSAMAVTTANVVVTGTIDATNNLVPAGSVVYVDVGGTADSGGSWVSLVQVRTRTRI